LIWLRRFTLDYLLPARFPLLVMQVTWFINYLKVNHDGQVAS